MTQKQNELNNKISIGFSEYNDAIISSAIAHQD